MIATFEIWMATEIQEKHDEDLAERVKSNTEWYRAEVDLNDHVHYLIDRYRRRTRNLVSLIVMRQEHLHSSNAGDSGVSLDSQPCLTDSQLRVQAELDAQAVAVRAFKQPHLRFQLANIARAGSAPALHAWTLALTHGACTQNNLLTDAFDIRWATEQWTLASLQHPSFTSTLEHLMDLVSTYEGPNITDGT